MDRSEPAAGLPPAWPGDGATAAKVRFLSRPDSYPDRPARVEVIETHFAWVFLTGRYAYKLKKPLRLGGIDMTNREARRNSCEQELALNRRLAGPTYLDIVTLAQAPDGGLALGGAGTPIDWLIRMHQLPLDRMLDAAIRNGTVRTGDLDALIARLVCFQEQAPVATELSAAMFRRRVHEQLLQIRTELLRTEFGLNRRLVTRLTRVMFDWVEKHGEVLDARVAARRVRELHGDLRPEHICLGAAPQIIDCIEFDRDLRILDCAEEMAYLAMECERLGARALSRSLLDRYREASHDPMPEDLLAFYQAQRAAMRAMLQVWHLRDGAVTDPGRWITAGSRYLRLGWRHAATLDIEQGQSRRSRSPVEPPA